MIIPCLKSSNCPLMPSEWNSSTAYRIYMFGCCPGHWNICLYSSLQSLFFKRCLTFHYIPAHSCQRLLVLKLKCSGSWFHGCFFEYSELNITHPFAVRPHNLNLTLYSRLTVGLLYHFLFLQLVLFSSCNFIKWYYLLMFCGLYQIINLVRVVNSLLLFTTKFLLRHST